MYKRAKRRATLKLAEFEFEPGLGLAIGTRTKARVF